MNWSIVTDNAGMFVQATGLTIAISLATIVLSVVIAFPLAIMRDLPIAPLRAAVATYSWMTRAVPALTLLFLAYYGLPQFGIFLDPVPAAIAGLTVSAAGYNMEYIRAGILSVPATQYEACKALGMPLVMALRRVIIPQAMRTILPPLTSNLTLLVKGSSLASLVAVSELTGQGMALISFTYQPVPILIAIAIIYLILNTVVVAIQAMVERRFSIP
jgi:amine acid ABC transporter, permease protein, 3-TM region, His/Glu/Gln/Arg/opine family